MDWNLLYGFPGETAADYAHVVDWLPAIRFLEPPGACGPLRLDRFSPYFTDPAAHGLTGLRPVAAYACLFPLPEASLARIAYYFDFAYSPETDPRDAAADARAAAEWRASPDPGTLVARPGAGGGLRLTDTRRACGGPRSFDLEAPEAVAYAFCDRVRSPAAIAGQLGTVFPGLAPSVEAVTASLDSMVTNRLMLRDEGLYLALAIDLFPPDTPLVSRDPVPLETLGERVC